MKHREPCSGSWCPWWGLRFLGVSKGDRHCPASLLYGSAREQAVLNQCPQGRNWPNSSGSPSWTWLCEGAVSPGGGAGEPSTEASPLLPYSPPGGPRGITHSPHTWFCLKSRWRSPPILFAPPWVAPDPQQWWPCHQLTAHAKHSPGRQEEQKARSFIVHSTERNAALQEIHSPAQVKVI